MHINLVAANLRGGFGGWEKDYMQAFSWREKSENSSVITENYRCCQAAFNEKKKKKKRNKHIAVDGELYVYHSSMAEWRITSKFLHHFWALGIWKQLWRAVLHLPGGCSHLVCLTGLQDLFVRSPGTGSLVLCHVGLFRGLRHCPHYSRVSDPERTRRKPGELAWLSLKVPQHHLHTIL